MSGNRIAGPRSTASERRRLDAADRAPAIPLPDIDRDEHSSSWGPEVIHQSPQTLENMEEPESDFSSSEVADAGGWGSSGSGISAAGRPVVPPSRLCPVLVGSSGSSCTGRAPVAASDLADVDTVRANWNEFLSREESAIDAVDGP